MTLAVPFVDLQRLHAPHREALLKAFARVLDSGGYVLDRHSHGLE